MLGGVGLGYFLTGLAGPCMGRCMGRCMGGAWVIGADMVNTTSVNVP